MLIHTLICKLHNFFDLKLILCMYILVPIHKEFIDFKLIIYMYIIVPIHKEFLHTRNAVEYSISRTLNVILDISYTKFHSRYLPH